MYIVQKIRVGGSGRNSIDVSTETYRSKREAAETWENYVNKGVGSDVGTDMIAEWDGDELEWTLHKGESVVLVRLELLTPS